MPIKKICTCMGILIAARNGGWRAKPYGQQFADLEAYVVINAVKQGLY